MTEIQAGILDPVPRSARYLSFSLAGDAEPLAALQALAKITDGKQLVAGLGLSLLKQLNAVVDGLHEYPARTGKGFDVPSTQSALWCWCRGEDPGALLHLSRQIEELLSPAFVLDSAIDAYRYLDGHDLTGYEDGTENPVGPDALAAAFVPADIAGLGNSSFVAVQQWLHDLDHFQSMSQQAQDHSIGRRLADNEEIEDAPESAHVKRTAQEDFEPEAFLLRRSMPWHDETAAGLVFVAFGKSLQAFEAQMSRMVGDDDGIVDALFGFTRPITGAYYWCPPIEGGELDLSLLGKASE